MFVTKLDSKNFSNSNLSPTPNNCHHFFHLKFKRLSYTPLSIPSCSCFKKPILKAFITPLKPPNLFLIIFTNANALALIFLASARAFLLAAKANRRALAANQRAFLRAALAILRARSRTRLIIELKNRRFLSW